jgi:transcriptional regulator with XRE-family HTH domain
VVTSVPAQILAVLKARKLTQRQLANRLDVTEARISQILTGERPVPKRKAEAWASALGLTGSVREDFLLEVDLTHASPRVQALITDLREQLSRSR